MPGTNLVVAAIFALADVARVVQMEKAEQHCCSTCWWSYFAFYVLFQFVWYHPPTCSINYYTADIIPRYYLYNFWVCKMVVHYKEGLSSLCRTTGSTLRSWYGQVHQICSFTANSSCPTATATKESQVLQCRLIILRESWTLRSTIHGHTQGNCIVCLIPGQRVLHEEGWTVTL